MIITCLNCGKDYKQRPSKVKRAKKHFCSISCRNEYYQSKKKEKEKNVRHRNQCKNDFIICKDYSILLVNSPKYGKKEILIDTYNIEKLNTIFWHIAKINDNYFSVIGYDKNTKKEVSIHRYLTNCPSGLIIDHINRNPLDNRMQNLRIVSHSENMLNGNVPVNNVIKHKGIRKRGNKFQARIMINKTAISIGHFNTLKEAIDARKNFCVLRNIIS